MRLHWSSPSTVATSRSITTSAVLAPSILSNACKRPRRATTFLTIFSGIPLGCSMCRLACIAEQPHVRTLRRVDGHLQPSTDGGDVQDCIFTRSSGINRCSRLASRLRPRARGSGALEPHRDQKLFRGPNPAPRGPSAKRREAGGHTCLVRPSHNIAALGVFSCRCQIHTSAAVMS